MKPFKPPTPLVTNSLIGLCVAVQAGMMIGGPGFADAVAYNFGLVPRRVSWALSGEAPVGYLFPAAVTHIFLHAGWIHLALNMVFLAWVGRYVEWVAGRWGLLLIFLLGGLIGGAVQVLAAPASLIPVVGASGSISAVFGAYAMMFANSRVSARRVAGIRISGEVLTALWYAASWIGLQLLVGYAFAADGGPHIASGTHIGGFLAGLLLARRYGRGPAPF
ncbi:rhomboid family intramembrane serine protease [Polymorphobacter sp.]|uniref:rhomboid family intramembrane serine protease n=1 Tax=Polymorphobacter sp. TaxID=1909290 RepID=UPI003F71FF86